MKLLYALYKMKMLSLFNLFRLIRALNKYGFNLMTLLHLAERTNGKRVAIVDDDQVITYEELFTQSESLSIRLKEMYQLSTGSKVALLCKNHTSLITSIFAVSRLGSSIYLLNTELSKEQLEQTSDKHHFDLIIYDYESRDKIEQVHVNKIVSYHDSMVAVSYLLNEKVQFDSTLPRTSSSKLILLTGGTTGKFKEVGHTPSLFNYLNPFLAYITRLNLVKYHSVYIATPIYHGYGLAVLFIFIALGRKIVISRRFEPDKACKLIREHQVEVATVVPVMIHKMLQHDAAALKSLKCIASGGAELNPKLVDKVFEKVGHVLYNLYGTSETGTNIIASPEDLSYSKITIGRKIKGAQLKVLDQQKQEVKVGTIGQFCIQNKWSMVGNKNCWIETGDMGYRDNNGYYFLCGRTDDMVVSGGVNVYPIELEQVLITHPKVEDVAVVGVYDEVYGQRLKSFIQPVKGTPLTAEELMEWLRPKVARYQMPKEINIINQIPYTSIGKIDKKQLN